MKKFLFLSLAAGLFLNFSVSAGNYFVSAESGNDSNSGLTPQGAKKTLSWFSWNTTFLKPGDTLFIMNGTYTGGTQFAILALRASGSVSNPLVITNFPDHKPLLKLNEYKWAGIHLAEGVHDIVINGLTIQGFASSLTIEEALAQPGSCSNPGGQPIPKFNGSGISVEGRTNGKHVHHITVSNCEIYECAGGGIASMEADYITIENNLIYNNCWYTIYGNSGISNLNSWNYDDHANDEYSMVIRNNILFGNQLFVPWIGPCKIYDGNGIIVDSQNNENKPFESYSGKTLIENNVAYDNGGRGIHVYKSGNVDIINNTCYFNGKSPELEDGEITLQEAFNMRVFNNIMYARNGERANLKYLSNTNISFGNNLIYNAASHKIGFSNATDIKNQNPDFINPDLENPDLKLSESSPARNTGIKASGLYSIYDINGISRLSGGIPDIGAYEFEEEVISNNYFFLESKNIRVYPNPAKNMVKISFSESPSPGMRYSLLNNSGKTILSGEFVNSDTAEISINNLVDGLYILKIWIKDDVYTQKILVFK